MSSEVVPPDQSEREAALDPGRSFIVQAPAGSGKTELLIRRILRLLPTLTAPEELVAITFTRKAAGEMRLRLFDALENATRTEPSQESAHARQTRALARAVLEHDRRLNWGLLDNPTRLRVQTIDAFCSSLCRRMPLAGGAAAAYPATDDTTVLYREAARRTLRMLSEQTRWQEPLQFLLAHMDNNMGAVEALLTRMLERRELWLRHVADPASPRLERAALEAALRSMIEDHLRHLQSLFPRPLLPEFLALARYATGNLQHSAEQRPMLRLADTRDIPGAAVDNRNDWLAVADFLLTADGKPRSPKGFRKTEGFPPAGAGPDAGDAASMKTRVAALAEAMAGHSEFLAALRNVRTLPPATYSDVQWRALDAQVQLLPVLAAQLMLVFDERGTVDHAAVMRAALDALGPEGEPTDLALALDHRIRHILVDEFQDTSRGQFQLLERLTDGWQEDDGRTLFLVGDPMQSIYRFREADVGLYLRARDQGIGPVRLQAITLRANFRAQARLVDWINTRFARLFPVADNAETGAVIYTPCLAVLPAASAAAVTVQVLPEGSAGDEARETVQAIERALREDPSGSVALLVKSRAHLDGILPALRARGVPVSAVDIDPLADRAVVRDLVALTRALLHPADRVAWLSVLRAPWCGLGLDDLEVVARLSDSENRTVPDVLGERRWQQDMSLDGAERLEALVRRLLDFLCYRERRGTQRWIEGAWLALGGAATAQSEEDLADAEAFFELLAELEATGDAVDPARLGERIEGLYARALPGGPGVLQVMTMHGAKGLEFDTVIVAGLGRRRPNDVSPLLRWLERTRADGQMDLLLASLGADRSSHDDVYQALRQVERCRDENETCRLLYVAATRARKSLWLVGTARRDKEGSLVPPGTGTLLGRLWPAVRDELLVTESDANAPAQAESPASMSWRLAKTWRPPAHSPSLAHQALPMPAPDAAGIEFSWASHTARSVGTVVHRALQRMAESNGKAWHEGAISGLAPALRGHLRALGVAETDVEAGLQQALLALRNVLLDPRGQWLLRPHAEARSELRMTAVLDGRMVRVAMDRTFVDPAGVRWVVDFKTGTHQGAGLDAFLDSEQARYREQLHDYARVLRLAGEDRPIRLALYFPLLQAWREWPGP